MKNGETKLYYPRRLPDVNDDGRDAERKAFYDFVRKVKDESVTSRSEYGDFYDYLYYEMADGTIYKYTINAEYGIPYSIEKLAKEEMAA